MAFHSPINNEIHSRGLERLIVVVLIDILLHFCRGATIAARESSLAWLAAAAAKVYRSRRDLKLVAEQFHFEYFFQRFQHTTVDTIVGNWKENIGQNVHARLIFKVQNAPDLIQIVGPR